MQNIIAVTYNKLAKEYVEKHWYSEHLSIPSLKEFLTYLSKKSRVLDIGCWWGQDSRFLIENWCEVVGVDVSDEMIKLAREYTPKAEFQVWDLMLVDMKKEFDWIWCCRVFHHISIAEQDLFLDKLNSLLKKDWILYITAFVSDNWEDYENFDSGNGNLLKKRNSEKSFRTLLEKHWFSILTFKYWTGNKWMEIIARKY